MYCSYSWILPKEAKLKLPSPTDLDYNLNGKPLGGQVKKIEKLHNFWRKSTLTRSPLKNQLFFLDWTSWYSASIFQKQNKWIFHWSGGTWWRTAQQHSTTRGKEHMNSARQEEWSTKFVLLSWLLRISSYSKKKTY